MIDLAFYGVAAVFLASLVVMAATAWWSEGAPWGSDYSLYMERARSWLAGDGFYLPRQLAGPYAVQMGDAMYPPVTLVLFVPFTVMPAVLWWAIPIALLAWSLLRLRLAPWAWALLAAMVYVRTLNMIVTGNPAMWSLALVAAGFSWAWAGPFAALKLTFAPFALVGIRHPDWRRGALVAIAMCVPFGWMWVDYSAALLNAHPAGQYDLGYAIADWPLAIAMVVACRASTRPDDDRGRRPSDRHPRTAIHGAVG